MLLFFFRYEVLVNVYDDFVGGYLGVYKIYEKLRDRYYWRGMYKDVEYWIRSCNDCVIRKKLRNKSRVLFLLILVSVVFDRMVVDIFGFLFVIWIGN